MNILFIALERIDDISKRGLYSDTLRLFDNGKNKIHILTAFEKRDRKLNVKNHVCGDVDYIYARTYNVLKNKNFIKKGIATVCLGRQYLRAFKSRKITSIDLVICTTPSITFCKLVSYVKNKYEAKCVLLLKDMWPYDLLFDNILSDKGLLGYVYKYLDKTARKLYDLSDIIGCMSKKNKLFLELIYNNGNNLDNAIIIPNSIEPLQFSVTASERLSIRKHYGLPLNKTIFIYGGNLGVAQGVDFIISSIRESLKEIDNIFFLIVGRGTEKNKLEKAFDGEENVAVLDGFPRDEYERLVYACDVGLVYLNWNCHTPNFPSRILQYMQASLPVICATDDTTDIGDICLEHGFGFKCYSNDESEFIKCAKILTDENTRNLMGKKSRSALENYFSAKRTCELITQSIKV